MVQLQVKTAFGSQAVGADGSHIVRGRDSAPHSRPYMASLQVRGRLVCGGALIREDFVLTAAHCQIPVPFTVIVGADTLSGNESTKQEFRSIRSIPHPRYDGDRNDIMLLQLNGSAQLTEAVQLIPLRRQRLRPSSACLTAGWGDVGDNRTIATRLQEVNVTTLSQKACLRRWKLRKFTIDRTMVCGVGAENFQGFCSGDSGGPLVCAGAAAGVVSFSGRRCGDARTPDVYTRVSPFIEWIAEMLNSSRAD
uniref:Peptidase S1 domain-containing protein n=1 Tax=Mola mola TaxID=94237 RepID=A0A3Q3VKK5_MOLML